MVWSRSAVLAVPNSPSADLEGALTERFGLRAFHGWQREAIEALLEGSGRVLLIAPTGGGKSLCYQLPATVLPGTTVVICPLIALMVDQVRGLEARGIPATFLASSLDAEERKRRLKGLRQGVYKIVYVAPERLAFEGFSELIGDIELSLLAVDEAHCIVQWGHDFRPDYLRIGALIDRLRPKRVIACTATATSESRLEILARLRLQGPETKVILRGFARPNLELSVREVEGAKDVLQTTDATLARALRGTLAAAPARAAARPALRGGAIVYTATRRAAENLAEKLADRGWKARPYHAGLASEQRSDVQRAFSDKSLPIVVATNAFGMGIDRDDVRAVIHAQPPASIEGYYQEVGRAGRDGAPAVGLLMLAPGDVPLRRRLCELGGDGGAGAAEQVERAWSLFRALLRYVDATTCRHDFILRYFGDDAESLGGCGRCDVCRDVERALAEDPAALERESVVVRKVLAAVARARGRGGAQAIAEMLRGKATERVVRFGFHGLSTFGLLPDHTQDDLTRLFRALIAAGFVDLTAGDYPMPILTRAGARVMRAEEPIRMRLPRRLEASARAASSGAARASDKQPRGGRRRVKVAGVGDGDARDALPVDAQLFEALRVHRAALASEAGVPAYVVAHDRTLAEMSARRPTTKAELGQVPGMGPVKVARYGDGFLTVIRRAPPG